MHDTYSPIQARYYLLSGHVQGVGFRPFVYHLAHEYQIRGWVENQMGQVAIHAEGNAEYLQIFQHKLIDQAPVHSQPVIHQTKVVICENFSSFTIRTSTRNSFTDVRVIPDLPICAQCLHELHDINNRRYRYPFINCTHCGPRYTLIRDMPYDRINTTMQPFKLCANCQQEYLNPQDRRYHAEPIACTVCGPSLQFQQNGITITGNQQAMRAAVRALQRGDIVAVKGIGGYHLVADACNDHAVTKLRNRKPRPHKPLAVMMNDAQLDNHVEITQQQRQFLSGSTHPILLVPLQRGSRLSPAIAPQLQEVGVMKPYSPLHVLLMDEFNGPLVATSANISGEPVLTDNKQVMQRLPHVADAFLHHNRRIQRPADDPVYRTIHGEPRVLRLGRGNAPLELDLPFHLQQPLLAVGGHMKNTVALAWKNRLVISPHIGELESLRSERVFEQVIDDLQNLYHIKAQHVVCDAHPQYVSHLWAKGSGLPYHSVYHHHAHASVLTGEYPEQARWLVFTWDGTGYGPDGTLWGGEALLGNCGNWQRVASLRPFHLPGGDKAGREPWRSAAALCWEAGIEWMPDIADVTLAKNAWHKNINCPQSSAMGRLFDAASCLTGLLDKASFEGQGPMWLEAHARLDQTETLALPINQDSHGIWRSDWHQLLHMLLDPTLSLEYKASCFHESLALMLMHQALQIRQEHGDFVVGLCGGVFQNRLLSERAITLLQQHGMRCFLPRRVPVNDGGLCFGQVIEASALIHSGALPVRSKRNVQQITQGVE